MLTDEQQEVCELVRDGVVKDITVNSIAGSGSNLPL